jgi:Pyruvate phosphate dikinase, AMP/ATP-binding domain
MQRELRRDMPTDSCVRWFKDIRLGDVPIVGGKTASLGELYCAMAEHGIKVPNGFALTAQAYRDALSDAQAWDKLHGLIDGLDKRQVKLLHKAAAAAREIVYAATGTTALRDTITAAYRQLEEQYGANVAVAVRSSATAEDLPTASFAGQHESFLNIRGPKAVFEACRRCFASIFTDRAISYRIDNGFDHFKVALSVGVMKMVSSDRAASGVIFTLDTESGFRDVVFVTGAYGLGENVVQGAVDPDEFYVHKPTFREGYRAVLSRSLGRKQKRMIYGRGKDAGTWSRPRKRSASASASATTMCSSSPDTRSQSRSIIHVPRARPPRWILNGPRMVRAANCILCKRGPKQWRPVARPRHSKPMPSRRVVAYWQPDARSVKRSLPDARASSRAPTTFPPFGRAKCW